MEGRTGLVAAAGASVLAASALGLAWFMSADDGEEDSDDASAQATPREAGEPSAADSEDLASLTRTMGALARTMDQLRQKNFLSPEQFAAYQAIPKPGCMQEFEAYGQKLGPLLNNKEAAEEFQKLFDAERRKDEEVVLKKKEWTEELKMRNDMKPVYREILSEADFVVFEKKLEEIRGTGFSVDAYQLVWFDLNEWVLKHLVAPEGWSKVIDAGAEKMFTDMKTQMAHEQAATLSLTAKQTKYNMQAELLRAKNPQQAQQFVQLCNAVLSGRVPADQVPAIEAYMGQCLGLLTANEQQQIEEAAERQKPAIVQAVAKKFDELKTKQFLELMNTLALRSVVTVEDAILLGKAERALETEDSPDDAKAALLKLQDELSNKYNQLIQAKLVEYAEHTSVQPPNTELDGVVKIQGSLKQMELELDNALKASLSATEKLNRLIAQYDAAAEVERSEELLALKPQIFDNGSVIANKLAELEQTWADIRKEHASRQQPKSADEGALKTDKADPVLVDKVLEEESEEEGSAEEVDGDGVAQE